MVLGKKFGAPLITNDGVTIAKEIELEDPVREHGRSARHAKLPPRPTMQPATVPPPQPCWHRRWLREGMKNVAAGANPMDLSRRGIAEGREAAAVEAMPCRYSKKVAGSADVARVATISAGDAVIGSLIAEAMEKVTSTA